MFGCEGNIFSNLKETLRLENLFTLLRARNLRSCEAKLDGWRGTLRGPSFVAYTHGRVNFGREGKPSSHGNLHEPGEPRSWAGRHTRCCHLHVLRAARLVRCKC